MKDKLSAFWSGFKDKWSSLAKNLRIFIITAVSVVIVAAIVLAIVLNQKGYTAIYTGLDSEESSQVVSAINELGITDVKMGTDGSISVPSDQADNVRMQLSIQGYPKSTFNFDVWNSGIGIWSTDTEKKVLQIQQLQTHLMKAINTISAVKNSYVCYNHYAGEQQLCYLHGQRRTESQRKARSEERRTAYERSG